MLYNEKLKTEAVIRADKEDKKIYIRVGEGNKREYFAVIRHTLLDIHASFPKLLYKELIPLPRHESETVEYSELIGYVKKGKPVYFSRRNIYVYHLL